MGLGSVEQHLVTLRPAGADAPYAADLQRVAAAWLASADRPRVVFHFFDEFMAQERVQPAVERWLEAYQKVGELYPVFFTWDGSLLDRVRGKFEAWTEKSFCGRMIATAYGIVRQGVRAVVNPTVNRGIAPDLSDDGLTDDDIRDLEDLSPDARGERMAGLTDAEWDAIKQQILAPEFLAKHRTTDPDLSDYAVKLEQWARDRDAPCPVDVPDGVRDAVTADLQTDTRAFTLGGIVFHHLLTMAFTAGWRAIKRFRAGRDHGLKATVVEEVLRELYATELGSHLRREMREEAEKLFLDGRAAALTDALAGRGTPVVGVVAHGLGVEGAASYFRYLRRTPTPHAPVRVVAVAPTVSFGRMSEILDFGGSDVTGVLAVGLDDAHERTDQLHPTLYPLSILYFASGLYEEEADYPYAGMQRFHELPPFKGKAAALGKWDWSPVPRFGANRHAEWNTDADTRATILGFLQ